MLQALLADTYSFWLPEQASSIGHSSDALFYFILGINIFFSTLIMALLILFVLLYRHRDGKKHDPTGGHSTSLELTWTIIPTLLVLVIFWFGFKGYLHANTLPPNAYEVTANASMWNWSFTYPNGVTLPELHLVVDQPTRITLQSADVIHDLDIPAFRMKKDAVPGRYNHTWFEPTIASPQIVGVSYDPKSQSDLVVKTSGKSTLFTLYKVGEKGAPDTVVKAIGLTSTDTYGFQSEGGKTVAVYVQKGASTIVPLDAGAPAAAYVWKYQDYFQVYCAMYCGQNHSTMLANCVVHGTQAEFDKWMADQTVWLGKESFIVRGEKLYNQQGCATCHSVDGSPKTGPTWKDLYGSMVPCVGGSSYLADDPYIAESILEPAAKIVQGFQDSMPRAYRASLKPEDIVALTWYMKSISTNFKGDLTPGKEISPAKGTAALAPGGPSSPTSQPAAVPATAPAK